jgi:hypothetical protein
VWPAHPALPILTRYALGVFALFVLGAAVAVAEGVLVKLKWRKVPNLLAFATVLSLLAALLAAAQA